MINKISYLVIKVFVDKLGFVWQSAHNELSQAVETQ